MSGMDWEDTLGALLSATRFGGRRWGLFAPKPRTRARLGPGPILGVSSGVAPGRPAKPACGAQSAPGKGRNGGGKASFSSAISAFSPAQELANFPILPGGGCLVSVCCASPCVMQGAGPCPVLHLAHIPQWETETVPSSIGFLGRGHGGNRSLACQRAVPPALRHSPAPCHPSIRRRTSWAFRVSFSIRACATRSRAMRLAVRQAAVFSMARRRISF